MILLSFLTVLSSALSATALPSPVASSPTIVDCTVPTILAQCEVFCRQTVTWQPEYACVRNCCRKDHVPVPNPDGPGGPGSDCSMGEGRQLCEAYCEQELFGVPAYACLRNCCHESEDGLTERNVEAVDAIDATGPPSSAVSSVLSTTPRRPCSVDVFQKCLVKCHPSGVAPPVDDTPKCLEDCCNSTPAKAFADPAAIVASKTCRPEQLDQCLDECFPPDPEPLMEKVENCLEECCSKGNMATLEDDHTPETLAKLPTIASVCEPEEEFWHCVAVCFPIGLKLPMEEGETCLDECCNKGKVASVDDEQTLETPAKLLPTTAYECTTEELFKCLDECDFEPVCMDECCSREKVAIPDDDHHTLGTSAELPAIASMGCTPAQMGPCLDICFPLGPEPPMEEVEQCLDKCCLNPPKTPQNIKRTLEVTVEPSIEQKEQIARPPICELMCKMNNNVCLKRCWAGGKHSPGECNLVCGVGDEKGCLERCGGRE